ncbi:MAG: AAA family ATPase [Succinivibrionaceae bacterium]|nr:AAA family ATPase [Succinivibrionaceae bacterium]
MGTYLNPNGINGFIRQLNEKDSGKFVDKTDFIRVTNSSLNTNSMLIAMIRPRRFGKSVMAGMLSAYYSKGYEGREIFKGLKISLKEKNNASNNAEVQEETAPRNVGYEPDDSYLEHMNKYDVIYIDMNVIKSLYTRYSRNNRKVTEVDNLIDFLEFKVISELKEEENFSRILEKCQIGNTDLLEALLSLRKYLDKQFVFIMDEWDLIYRDFRDDEDLQDQYLDWLRGLFKSDEGLQCFSLVYLTGILPIKKDYSESSLNNFLEYNMLKPGNYEEYFGFTDKDVQELIQNARCRLSYQELKDWYDGYKLNGKDIYNPNSVITAIRDGICDNNWSGTASNEEVLRLINMNFMNVRNDIVNLIQGAQIPFNCKTFKNDMVSIKHRNHVFSLLVCLGYLGCANAGAYDRLAYVPNREIRSALVDLVEEQPWADSIEIIKQSDRMFDAIRQMDGVTVAELMTEIHNSRDVSMLKYNSEEALVSCLITGLRWRTCSGYDCIREMPSGKGFADLIYVPVSKPDLPIMIIEFKCGRSAQEALDQIRKKRYYSRYLEGNYPNDILLLGISYDPEAKEHECLIEKLDRK